MVSGSPTADPNEPTNSLAIASPLPASSAIAPPTTPCLAPVLQSIPSAFGLSPPAPRLLSANSPSALPATPCPAPTPQSSSSGLELFVHVPLPVVARSSAAPLATSYPSLFPQCTLPVLESPSCGRHRLVPGQGSEPDAAGRHVAVSPPAREEPFFLPSPPDENIALHGCDPPVPSLDGT